MSAALVESPFVLADNSSTYIPLSSADEEAIWKLLYFVGFAYIVFYGAYFLCWLMAYFCFGYEPARRVAANIKSEDPEKDFVSLVNYSLR
jgi:hypothetical protein